jgi:hypothetical protein
MLNVYIIVDLKWTFITFFVVHHASMEPLFVQRIFEFLLCANCVISIHLYAIFTINDHLHDKRTEPVSDQELGRNGDETNTSLLNQ